MNGKLILPLFLVGLMGTAGAIWYGGLFLTGQMTAEGTEILLDGTLDMGMITLTVENPEFIFDIPCAVSRPEPVVAYLTINHTEIVSTNELCTFEPNVDIVWYWAINGGEYTVIPTEGMYVTFPNVPHDAHLKAVMNSGSCPLTGNIAVEIIG